MSSTEEHAPCQFKPAEEATAGELSQISGLPSEETPKPSYPAEKRRYQAHSMSGDVETQPPETGIEPATNPLQASETRQETFLLQSTPLGTSEALAASPFLPTFGQLPAPVPAALLETSAAEFAATRFPPSLTGRMLGYPEHHPGSHATTTGGQFELTSAPQEAYAGSFAAPPVHLIFAQSWDTNMALSTHASMHGNHEARPPQMLAWRGQAPSTVWAEWLGPTAMSNTFQMQPAPGYYYTTSITLVVEPLGYFGPFYDSFNPETEYISMSANSALDTGSILPVQLPQPNLPPGAQVWQDSRFPQFIFVSIPEAP